MSGQLRAGVVPEYLPCAGQDDAAWATLEQGMPELLLQTLDGAGQRRRAHVCSLGTAREVQALGQAQEKTQLVVRR